MSVANASQAQLAQVCNFSLLTRSIMVQLATLVNACNAAMTTWDANILGIIGAPQGTPIPDGTGLQGAVELTDTQLTNLVGYMTAILSTYGAATEQQAIALAVGPQNMLSA